MAKCIACKLNIHPDRKSCYCSEWCFVLDGSRFTKLTLPEREKLAAMIVDGFYRMAGRLGAETTAPKLSNRW